MIEVPCGQCINCRLEKARQWAIRCTHEAQLYKDNCYLTLTYNDIHLPSDKSVHKKEIQNFIRRIRKITTNNIRYFACGEYGEECEYCHLSKDKCRKYGCRCFKPTIGRAHYHICIFNYDFKDKRPWKTSKTGYLMYRSEILENL